MIVSPACMRDKPARFPCPSWAMPKATARRTCSADATPSHAFISPQQGRRDSPDQAAPWIVIL